MSDKRNKLRAQIFKSSNKEIETIEMNGFKIEVHQPTIGEIADLNQDDDTPRSETISDTIIKYCYVPGSNEKVFSAEDRDGILNLPATILNEFNIKFAKLTKIDLEGAEKNLEGQ